MPVKNTSNADMLYAMVNSNVLKSISAEDIKSNNENLFSLFDTDLKRNELIGALIDVIALQSLNKAVFENPLKAYKSSEMSVGKVEQELFVNLIDGRDYDIYALDVDELYKIYKDNTMSVFHSVNARKQFPTSVSYDDLRSAFLVENGLQDLVNAKISVLYDSAEYWEYQRTRLLLTAAIQHGFIYPHKIAKVENEETSKNLLKYVRAYVEGSRFPNHFTNYAGSDSTARPSEMTLFVTPLVKASIDVDTLASIFNLSYAETLNKIVVVDTFENDSVQAVLIDDRFLHIRQQLAQMTNNYNAVNLSWNYFYNLWEMFSISPFRTAIVFTTDKIGGIDKSTSTMVFEQAEISASKGSQVKLLATINDTAGGYIPQLIEYQITSVITSPKTMLVPGTSLLLIGDDETAETITVTAVNRMSNDVKANATVTVTI